ncbi:MAG: S8 family serine peptidase [Thermomicrobiales bacterium]|nr:S8 family serine peptidase [Thermomicrobiales bacterium]
MLGARPAWSHTPEELTALPPVPGLELVTPDWAWGDSSGAGVKVGVIDSGIDDAHPAIAGRVRGYISFQEGADRQLQRDDMPHADAFGHGTACADIIRRLAPDVELYSVKVLGARLSGKGTAFAAGLRWAIEAGMRVINLSLGTTKQEFFSVFHELADLAYFRNTILVTAANNLPVVSYPSLYASVISVACHEDSDPYAFYYNPAPPVEFLAPGIDVTVAWRGGGAMTVTGNSFSAPHITGLVAKILAKHPGLTPFQVKTILRATARNVSRAGGQTGGRAGGSR